MITSSSLCSNGLTARCDSSFSTDTFYIFDSIHRANISYYDLVLIYCNEATGKYSYDMAYALPGMMNDAAIIAVLILPFYSHKMPGDKGVLVRFLRANYFFVSNKAGIMSVWDLLSKKFIKE